MGQLGFSEILVIFIIALLVFGPKKLPDLGKSLGKGIREFRKATDELKSSWEEQVKDISAPLNDVKKDIHNMREDLKSDFYNSIESELGHDHSTTMNPTASETSSHPAETAAPKEHV